MKYIIFFILIQTACLAQQTGGVSFTLPSVALLDIEPNTTGVNLGLTASLEAGDAPYISSSNSSKWINFTSAVTPSGSRNVTVQLTGALPAGINILLDVSPYSGSGAGSLGSPASGITLSGTPQNIITGIGGAYTGNGQGNGYNLTYSLEISNFSLIRQQTATPVVLFTIIDN